MEDDLKNKMEDEPINLIGCDTIVNSPSNLSCENEIKYEGYKTSKQNENGFHQKMIQGD